MSVRIMILALLAVWLPVQAQVLIYQGIIREVRTGNGDMERRGLRAFMVVGPDSDETTLIETIRQGRTDQFVADYTLDEEWEAVTWEELSGRRDVPTSVLTALDVDDVDDSYFRTLVLEGANRRALLYRDGRERVYEELPRMLSGSGFARDRESGLLIERVYRFRLHRVTQQANLDHQGEGLTHEEALQYVYDMLNLSLPPAP